MELWKYTKDNLCNAMKHVLYAPEDRYVKETINLGYRREGIIAKIIGLSSEDQELVQTAAAEEKWKQKSEGFDEKGQKKRRMDEDLPDNREGILRSFMEPVGENVVQEWIKKLITKTDNDALRLDVCGVCARERPCLDIKTYLIADIPNRHLLKPFTYHPAHDLTHGLLLHKRQSKMGTPYPIPARESEVGVCVCGECVQDLKKGQVPLYSLANNMWIGDIPHELDVLTLPESVLVA